MLTATTTSASDGDYDDHVTVLDDMIESLERVEFDATCWGAVYQSEPLEQPELPRPVAETRARIVDRAVACDFEGLAQIADEGEGAFTYSFGETGNPAEFWRRQEQESRPGPQPTRYLVGLLNRPFDTREVEGRTHYLWPSAFAYDSWEEVPDEDRDALKPLYTEVNFRGFERFGGYIGYRIGFDADGNWLFFVAGD